jgi:hypothetical protein
MSLRFFQRSSGLTQVVGNVNAYSAEALRPCQSNVGIQLSLLSAVSYLGKIHPRTSPSPSALNPINRYRPSWGVAADAQVPNWESLKVIALDKNGVNSNLSSGNQSLEITSMHRFIHQILLHKVKTSPYLRLVE